MRKPVTRILTLLLISTLAIGIVHGRLIQTAYDIEKLTSQADVIAQRDQSIVSGNRIYEREQYQRDDEYDDKVQTSPLLA